MIKSFVSLRSFLKVVAVVVFAVLFVFVGESIVGHTGALLCVVEVTLSFVAAIFVVGVNVWRIKIKRIRIAMVFFALFLFLLGFADGAYALKYYYFKNVIQDQYSVFLITIPYTISYICASFAVVLFGYSQIKSHLFKIHIIIPVVMSLATLTILLPLEINYFLNSDEMELILYCRMINIVSSFVMMSAAMTYLLITRSVFWLAWCVGVIAIVVVNLSLAAELHLGLPHEFGYYEYLWFVGILFCSAPVFLFNLPRHLSNGACGNSMVSQSRAVMYLAIAFVLLFAVLSRPISLGNIEFISLGIILACILAIIASQLLADKMTMISAKMGVIVSDSIGNASVSSALKEMPLELQEEFQRIFAQRIEYERKKTEWDVQAKMVSACIAHDMRSPLSVLNAFVQHYETCGDSDEREFAGAAHRSVKKLLHMADDFLDYGKAKILNRTPCNLKQVYYEFVEPECSKDLRDKGLSIDLNIDPHLYANIDSHKISRTMTNLVQNAVRAVEKQKGRIEVGAMEGRSGELIIIVSDNGCGIPKADLEKIYESFYSTDKKLGTGLGLSYCKQVVEVHDGTIDVQSDVNKGTIFTIMLPDCVVSESEVLANISADTAAGNVVVNKRTGVPGPEKVLIVDDDDGVRMQWKRLIDERGGRIVYSASSVKEAQSSLGVDYTMIDTAIVDYEYAGEEQNGVDLVAFLKRNGVKTVYLCTGYYRDEEICHRAKEAGAESVLSKPIDASEVSEIFS